MAALTTLPAELEQIAAEIARLKAENAALRARRLAHGMTPADARCFRHKNLAPQNQSRVLESAQLAVRYALDCDCQPYEDILTLRRWNALGYRVNKGEHACARVGKSEKIALFCRCQTNAGPRQYFEPIEDDDIPF